jgi:hypothetical protein
MSPGGCARVMALTPPTGARYNERTPVGDLNDHDIHEGTKQRSNEPATGASDPHAVEGPYKTPRCFASRWDMELAGIEPATSALQRRRSPS